MPNGRKRRQAQVDDNRYQGDLDTVLLSCTVDQQDSGTKQSLLGALEHLEVAGLDAAYTEDFLDRRPVLVVKDLAVLRQLYELGFSRGLEVRRRKRKKPRINDDDDSGDGVPGGGRGTGSIRVWFPHRKGEPSHTSPVSDSCS